MNLKFELSLSPEERSDLREAIEHYKDVLIDTYGNDCDGDGNFNDTEANDMFGRLDSIRAVL
jgi:hypothetical protein